MADKEGVCPSRLLTRGGLRRPVEGSVRHDPGDDGWVVTASHHMGFEEGSAVHVHALTRSKPAPSIYVEQVLDIISSIIGVIQGLEGLLGFDLAAMLGKSEETT